MGQISLCLTPKINCLRSELPTGAGRMLTDSGGINYQNAVESTSPFRGRWSRFMINVRWLDCTSGCPTIKSLTSTTVENPRSVTMKTSSSMAQEEGLDDRRTSCHWLEMGILSCSTSSISLASGLPSPTGAQEDPANQIVCKRAPICSSDELCCCFHLRLASLHHLSSNSASVSTARTTLRLASLIL